VGLNEWNIKYCLLRVNETAMEKRKRFAQPDTRSLDINDDYAMEFWAREFVVSKKKLKAAILVAGTSAMDVRRELKK
jgi:hypothetical protein